jgi:hypothetical protein
MCGGVTVTSVVQKNPLKSFGHYFHFVLYSVGSNEIS